MERKYTYRLPPCPDYEIEAMQCWLEDMAKEGYILADDGFFMGFAKFEPAAPQSLRYRLEPAPKASDSTPDQEAKDIHEAFGWRYVARRGQFYIYCASDPHAPEPNTDPHVQELALRSLTKRIRTNIIWSIFHVLFLGWLNIGYMLTITTAFLGTGKILLGIFIVVQSLVERLVSALRLKGMRKQLTQGLSLTQKADYRKRRFLHWGNQIAGWVLPVLWLVLIFIPKEETLLTDGVEPFPFATLADIFPEAQMEYDDAVVDSTVSVYSDVLIPQTIEYRSNVDLLFPDGSSTWGNLHVNYHRASSPWLAKRLAVEYEHHYGRQDLIFSDKKEEIPLSGIEADYARCYSNGISITLILCKGNEVVRCVYSVHGYETDADVQHFAQVMLASIS